MPTGYTADLKETTTLQEFALLCARAFGATITLRDEPLDVPIPEFTVADYYIRNLEDAKENLRIAAAMTLEQAAAAMEAANVDDEARRRRLVDESAAKRRSYERMSVLVNDWQPPTEEHAGLKKFMLDQLTESMKFDCHDADFADRCYPGFSGTPEEWLLRHRLSAHEEVIRARKRLDEETERVRSRNAWVLALRESLADEPAIVGS